MWNQQYPGETEIGQKLIITDRTVLLFHRWNNCRFPELWKFASWYTLTSQHRKQPTVYPWMASGQVLINLMGSLSLIRIKCTNCTSSCSDSSEIGYDNNYSWHHVDRFICKMCHLPSIDPHLRVCCGHILCNFCLDNAKKDSSYVNHH